MAAVLPLRIMKSGDGRACPNAVYQYTYGQSSDFNREAQLFQTTTGLEARIKGRGIERSWKHIKTLYEKDITFAGEPFTALSRKLKDVILSFLPECQFNFLSTPTSTAFEEIMRLDLIHGYTKRWREWEKQSEMAPETAGLAPLISLEEAHREILKIFPWNSPPVDYYDTPYVNRKDIEEKLFAWLQGTDGLSDASCLVLHGMAGVGKTALAKLAFFNAHHPIKIWFSASSLSNLENEYHRLWTILSPEDEKLPKDKCVVRLNDWLEKNPGHLVVYDNINSLEEIHSYLPKKGFSLLTSRSNRGCHERGLLVQVMSREEGEKLVKKVLGYSSGMIRSLISELGLHPLALSLATYTIKNSLPMITIKDYIEKFKSEKARVLHSVGDIENFAVYVTLSLVLKQLKQKNPLAVELLFLCAYLNHEDIPQEFLLGCVKELAQVFIDLQSYSFFQVDLHTKLFTIQPLIQEAIRSFDQGKERHLALVIEYYKKLLDTESHRHSPFLTTLFLSHLRCLKEHCANSGIKNTLLEFWLLEQIARIESTYMSPLMLASGMGQVDAMRLLLDRGADINAQNGDGYTPLMLATYCERLEVMRLLLDRGAGIEVQNSDGWTVLTLAADSEQEKAFVGASDGISSDTVLMMLTDKGQVEAMSLLLDRGADIEAVGKHGCTPLMRAASRGRIEAMRLLLDRGADKAAQDWDGKTPLMLATQHGQIQAVHLLRERRASSAAGAVSPRHTSCALQ